MQPYVHEGIAGQLGDGANFNSVCRDGRVGAPDSNQTCGYEWSGTLSWQRYGGDCI